MTRRIKSEKYGGFEIDFYRNPKNAKEVIAYIEEYSDRSDNPKHYEYEVSGRTKKRAFDEMKEVIDSINRYHLGLLGGYLSQMYEDRFMNERDDI